MTPRAEITGAFGSGAVPVGREVGRAGARRREVGSPVSRCTSAVSGDQGCQAGDEIDGLERDVGGAVEKGMLELVHHQAIGIEAETRLSQGAEPCSGTTPRGSLQDPFSSLYASAILDLGDLAWSTRCPSMSDFRVEPLDSTLGATVTNIDLARLDDQTFKTLYQVWLEHALLIFPDQQLVVHA